MSDYKDFVASVIQERELSRGPASEGEPIEAAARTGILDALPQFKVFGASVSDAAKALAVQGAGDVIGALAGRFMANLPSWAVSLGTIWALDLKMIRGFLGSSATSMGQFLIMSDAVQSVVDIRGRVAGLLGGILPEGAARRRLPQPNRLPLPHPARRPVSSELGRGLAVDVQAHYGGIT